MGSVLSYLEFESLIRSVLAGDEVSVYIVFVCVCFLSNSRWEKIRTMTFISSCTGLENRTDCILD